MLSLKKYFSGLSGRVGLAAASAAGLLMLSIYWHCGSGTGELAFALGFPPAFGASCLFLARRRFFAWLAGLVLGFIGGLISALPLLTGAGLEGEFYVSVATLLFFIVLGFILGAAGEFVRLLHFVAHGGSIVKYPDLPPAAEQPPWPRV